MMKYTSRSLTYQQTSKTSSSPSSAGQFCALWAPWLTLPPYQKKARAHVRVEGSTFLAGEKEMENENVFPLAKAERESTDPGCNFAGSPALFFISGTVRKR